MFKKLSSRTFVSITFTMVVACIVFFSASFPTYDSLQPANGQVEWFTFTDSNRSDFIFKLKNDNRQYIYHPVNGSRGGVASELNRPDVHVSVLYDPNNTETEGLALQRYNTVYEVVVDDLLISSYRMFATEYEYDDRSRIGPVLLIFGLIVSVISIILDRPLPRH